MAELKDTHTGTSPVISRALKTHLDSLEGVIFTVQKCFAPADSSTAFQFQQEQSAEDSDQVPNDFMDTLLPNKNENCVEKMKQVQEKKHEIEEEQSHKEKVIALKVQPQRRAEQAVLFEKISPLDAGMQQLAQEERQRSADLEAELQEKRQRSADLEAELQEERQRSSNLEAELQEERQSSSNLEAELQEERQRSSDRVRLLQRISQSLQEERQSSSNLEAELQSYINDNAYMRSRLDSLDNAILEDRTNGRPPRCRADTERGSPCLRFANELPGCDIYCLQHYEMSFGDQ